MSWTFLSAILLLMGCVSTGVSVWMGLEKAFTATVSPDGKGEYVNAKLTIVPVNPV